MARTRQHVVETQSRRIVSSLLPPERFVERDQSERDYGIDMAVECFDERETTGSYLLLQIKGTEDAPPSHEVSHIPFDFSVKALQRVERFITPVLLVWCPVSAAPPTFWYVWLQEYILVHLEVQNPAWRSQLASVRIHIPSANRVGAGNEEQFWILRHIADYPKRLSQFGQLARIAHEARSKQNSPVAMLELFREALELQAIFGDPKWGFGQKYRKFVEQGSYVAEVYISGRVPTKDDYVAIGMQGDGLTQHIPIEDARADWLMNLPRYANLLSNACAIFFDYKLKRTVLRADSEVV